MSGFHFILSPYLQNAACDPPGDSVPCSEHHVWSPEPHQRSSPGRIFLPGNPDCTHTWESGKGRECLGHRDAQGWLFCPLAEHTSFHKKCFVSPGNAQLVADLLHLVYFVYFFYSREILRNISFFFISPFLYFILDPFLKIILNKHGTVNNFKKGKKKKCPDCILTQFYLAGTVT